MDFNLEIIHPVFRNNICQELTEDHSKKRRLKNEITHASKLKDSADPQDAVITLFRKK